MNTRETQLKAFDRLLGIMEELREKCPWDKQTLQTLRHLTIEETYELGMPDNDLTEVKKRNWETYVAYCFFTPR
jgi:XTP/dITP diphosphohydrolase